MKELKLKASDDTLYTVLDELKAALMQNGCPDDILNSILIAAEEIYVNIAHYAYGGKPGKALVGIDVGTDTKLCRLIFKDKGTPYNPLDKPDPDITLSAEERGIGGLGIYMVKEIMDKVEYEYKDGQNILIMEKKFA